MLCCFVCRPRKMVVLGHHLTAKNVSYAWLVVAVITEIIAGNFMKTARGFEDGWHTFLAFFWVNICISATILFLTEIDLSIGWAIYTAFEFAGIVAAGVILWGEPLTASKIIGLAVTLFGVLVLIFEDEGIFERMEAKGIDEFGLPDDLDFVFGTDKKEKESREMRAMDAESPSQTEPAKRIGRESSGLVGV